MAPWLGFIYVHVIESKNFKKQQLQLKNKNNKVYKIILQGTAE